MTSVGADAGSLLRPRAAPTLAGCAAFVLASAHLGIEPRALIAAFVISTLAVVSVVDVQRRVIPNAVVLPATAIVVVAQTAFFPERSAESVLAAVGTALFLLLPALVSPAAMGMGDVKLGLLLGAALGRDVVAGLALGAVAALPVALWVLVRAGRGAHGATIPYGPFLALGAAVVLLAGPG